MQLQFESVVAIRVHPGCLFSNNPANSAITCGSSGRSCQSLPTATEAAVVGRSRNMKKKEHVR
ncbi:hypothetical protein QC761_0105110 [Podospora bellae-mahoneyi]|uniref:Uncharacterized protein n=1 Tax=Podospora bellae-mahoneyi TaxID=2093777 RepID=A0ABR0F822_9PEZI|nr:hypothetical protein QC761_0105110 [Podospora bellae-mahoneyi]